MKLTDMKDLICKMARCKKVNPNQALDDANAELLLAAKTMVRVAVYKTEAVKWLSDAVKRVEEVRKA